MENTLESPLDCKEIQPVHSKGDQSWVSLKGLMLKLKLQYFGHLMWRVDSLEKTLMLGGIGGRRRRGRQRMRWLYGITDSMDVSLSELREMLTDRGVLACCNSWGRKESDTTERLNWTKSALRQDSLLESRGWNDSRVPNKASIGNTEELSETESVRCLN